MVSKKLKITPTFSPKFNKFIQKNGDLFAAAVEFEVHEMILLDPLIGVQKAGDLNDYWVHKFKFKKQEFLIAYRFPKYQGKPDEVRQLLSSKKSLEIEVEVVDIDLEFKKIGTHENFYPELKKETK